MSLAATKNAQTPLEGKGVKILSSGAIWLSDYAFLNDREEVEYGLRCLRETADNLKAGSPGPRRRILDAVVDQLRAPHLGERRVYVASFSEDPDSLSQWRAYGDVAIGFDASSLQSHGLYGHFEAVTYDRRLQADLAAAMLNHLVQVAERSDQPASALVEHGVRFAAYLKHPAFAEEREVRLAGAGSEGHRLRQMMPLGVPPAVKRNFRPRGQLVVPYLASSDLATEFTEDERRALAGGQEPMEGWRALKVREIWIGPAADERLEPGVRQLLSSLGMHGVAVRRSEAPYRT